MKSVLMGIIAIAGSLVGSMALAGSMASEFVASPPTTSEIHKKVFTWPDAQLGSCHQSSAKLILFDDGNATFVSEVWNEGNGIAVFHSVIQLAKVDKGIPDSPAQSQPLTGASGAANAVQFKQVFIFVPQDFNEIASAVQKVDCS